MVKRRSARKAEYGTEAHGALQAALPLPYHVLDPGGIVLGVNALWLDRFGYRRKEVIGRRFEELLASDSKATFHELLTRMQPGEVLETSIDLIRKDGARVHTRFCGVTEHDARGRPQSSHWLLCEAPTASDTAGAQPADELLLRRMFENSPDAVYLLNLRSGEVEYFNRSSFCGRTPKDLGSPDSMFASLHPQDVEAVAEHWHRIRSGTDGREGFIDFRWKTVGSDWAWVRSREVVLDWDKDGTPTRLLITLSLITRQKQVETELRQQRNRAQQYLDVAGVMFVAIDRNGVVTLVNQKACEVLGRTQAEILGQDWFSTFLPERERDQVRGVFDRLMAGEIAPVETFENAVVDAAGKERWIAWKNTLLHDETGQILGSLSSGEDVTERKAAQTQLQLTMHSLETATPAVFWISPEGRFIYVNDAACRHLDYSKDELLGMSVADVDPEHTADIRGQRWRMLKDAGSLRFESMHRRKDGRTIPVEVIDHYVCFEGKEYEFAFAQDITERKEAETALQRTAKQLRDLRTQLDHAEEAERKRIARELHDQISQNLTALSINAGAIGNALGESSLEISGHLRDCTELIVETADQIRNLTFALRPPVLDDFGLSAALEWHAERVSAATGLNVRIGATELVPRPSPECEIALFRIAQEALTNIAKHAQATEARIGLDEDDGTIRLRIEDDGVGFDPVQDLGGSQPAGWGLLNMRERTESLGGRFVLDAPPGGGTRILVEVPR